MSAPVQSNAASRNPVPDGAEIAGLIRTRLRRFEMIAEVRSDLQCQHAIFNKTPFEVITPVKD